MTEHFEDASEAGAELVFLPLGGCGEFGENLQGYLLE